MNILTTILSTLLITSTLSASELKVTADHFDADQQKGVSVFRGHVNIQTATDELNATKVTIYTDSNNKPTKFVAEGDVSFFLVTQTKDTYRGEAQKAIYRPTQKVYEFYKDAHLVQINKKREINGDELVVNLVKGTAIAKGGKEKPVVMTFDLGDSTPKSDDKTKKTETAKTPSAPKKTETTKTPSTPKTTDQTTSRSKPININTPTPEN